MILNSRHTKLDHVWAETCIKHPQRIAANTGEKSRANAGPDVFTIPPRSSDRVRLLTQRRQLDILRGGWETREFLVQTEPGLSKKTHADIESPWNDEERKKKEKIRALSLSSSATTPRGVPVVANGISNVSRDRRFSMGASSSYTTSLRAGDVFLGLSRRNNAVNCGNRSATPPPHRVDSSAREKKNARTKWVEVTSEFWCKVPVEAIICIIYHQSQTAQSKHNYIFIFHWNLFFTFKF